MVGRSDYIVVPVATQETINVIYRELRDYNIINIPLLVIEPLYNVLDEVVDALSDTPRDMVSVFTSKNGVDVLLGYLAETGRLDMVRWLFRRVACIGPSTLKHLRMRLNNYCPGFAPVETYIPEVHTSRMLARLLAFIPYRPVLWASRYVDSGLASLVSSRGGVAASIYSIRLDLDNAESVSKLIDRYSLVFLIFMSMKSLEFLRIFRGRAGQRLVGIFISPRVYRCMDSSKLDGVHVYDGGDINGFYRFVRGVLG